MGAETFPVDLTEKERELASPFFTNVDRNIFGLINLPEVIKGTLFSRYSRSDKSARKLLLDEFMPNKDVADVIQTNMPGKGLDSIVATQKAEDFYQRVLVGYGDDSVAELAGAHVACENISSLAGDLLTDSRIGLSYLEKSARYMPFDKKVNGMYMWYRDPKIMDSKFAEPYSSTMDKIFDLYGKWIPVLISYIKEANPKTDDTTDRAYESATRAKALDVLKNMLPAGRLTNVGLFGNGRAYEYLLTKLYSSGIAEGVDIANRLHEELRKMMPAFVKRSQLSEYIVGTKEGMAKFAEQNIGAVTTERIDSAYTKLVDYDKDGEAKVLAAMLYPYSNLPLGKLREVVNNMGTDKRKELVGAYLSKRRNRRDKPGRALENSYYTFEMCVQYGMFRDFHRHRQLSIEKQMLTTRLGYEVPRELEFVGLTQDYRALFDEIAEVHQKMEKEMPIEAQYIVPRGFRMLWYMKMNLREVYHITELRSTKQGHPDYRKVAQDMRNLVNDVHPALAEYMQVDMNEYALPRIDSEKRIDKKLAEMDRKAQDGTSK
ncbi:MAG: FAD-dependent thymidylate synthase [Candidatus Micrarchaeota archaeon]|nr:FAD-dependent thymidylate synthase [Candidatus Micrarchaeota archaeon]